MKITVLGLGKIGHAMAALLCSRGFEVTGFTRDPEKASAVNRHGITVSGALTGNYPIRATTDLDAAVDGARFLVVTTSSRGHKPLAERLKGRLQPGQRIVIFTGNWGAYEFYTVLREEARAKQVVLGETSGNLAAVPTLTHPATVFLKTPKARMSFAAIPAAAAPQVVEELRQALPELYPVRNILDTSMNNTNPPVHVPVCLFNITRMANGEEARFYGECMPPVLLDLLMAADRERCAVARAIGAEPKSVLELMNAAWQTHYDDIKTLGQENPSLRTVMLPKTPYHRFLLEDVPFGFLAVSRLGKQYGVPTPLIDGMVELYQALLGQRAEMTGPEFLVPLSEVL